MKGSRMKKNYKFGFTLTEAVITMTIIGVVSALLLPMANKENLKTDDKGDKMMPIIGIMLFICAIFSCLMSFMTK